MQIYTPKTTPVRMSTWNGGHDEEVVQELRDFGFTVAFQESPVETEHDWDDDTGEQVEVPARGCLVAVGRYNWDTLHFAPGSYIVFRLVNIETGEYVEWTDENLNDPANKVVLFDRSATQVAKGYDLIG